MKIHVTVKPDLQVYWGKVYLGFLIPEYKEPLKRGQTRWEDGGTKDPANEYSRRVSGYLFSGDLDAPVTGGFTVRSQKEVCRNLEKQIADGLPT